MKPSLQTQHLKLFDWILVSLLLTLLSACSTQQALVSVKTSPITEQSVWQGNADLCRQGTDRVEDCLIAHIRKTGHKDAVQAAQYIMRQGNVGYVSGYQAGKVSVASVTYPFRANTTTGIFLIAAEGTIIDVDDVDAFLKNEVVWKTFLKSHPNALVWPTQDPPVLESKDGLIKIAFSHAVRVCRACEDIGEVEVRYLFDEKGRFLQRESTVQSL